MLFLLNNSVGVATVERYKQCFQQLEVHTTYGDFFRFSQEGFFTWLDFLRMPEVQQNLYAVGGN